MYNIKRHNAEKNKVLNINTIILQEESQVVSTPPM